MPKLKDDSQINKLYYRMGEVSSMLGLAPSLLRFWEKEFECLKNLHKNRKGDRLYTAKNIEDLKTIQYLVREKGYTLQGANDFMENNRKTSDKNAEMLKSLEKIKVFLEELRSNM